MAGHNCCNCDVLQKDIHYLHGWTCFFFFCLFFWGGGGFATTAEIGFIITKLNVVLQVPMEGG